MIVEWLEETKEEERIKRSTTISYADRPSTEERHHLYPP